MIRTVEQLAYAGSYQQLRETVTNMLEFLPDLADAETGLTDNKMATLATWIDQLNEAHKQLKELHDGLTGTGDKMAVAFRRVR